jgi:hypothetical protein
MASLLSLTDISAELDTDLLSVHRLIALGILPATNLGNRIVFVPDLFIVWVQAGADGFRDLRDLPDPIADGEGSYRAQEAARVIRTAAESQRLPDAMAETRGRRAAGESRPGGMLTAVLQVPLVPTGEVRAAASEPLQTAMKIRGTVTQPAGDYFLQESIRVAVKQAWEDRRQRPGSGKPIDPERPVASWLYSLAPDGYRAVIDAAIVQALAAVITFDEIRQYPDRGEGSLRLQVTYTLTTSSWAAPSRARELADQLF